MVRPVQSLGRPGTPVIPAGWQEAHGHVAAETMTATVSLRHPGAVKTYEDRATTYVPLTAYATDQAARIHAMQSRAIAAGTEQAEETLQVAGYLISLEYSRNLDSEPATGDLVDVTACPDPLLVGRTLKVADVVRGSLRFSRDLFCTLVDPAELVTS